ncbi:MAG: hypothetical protein K0Q48_886 [Bacillota bacterium]|jgi:acetaldehyde dehydrogenase (acetylating)|nr:hypothetical protein [Bacillota bacterium]
MTFQYDLDLVSVQEARDLVAAAKKAQKVLEGYSQEKIDRIVKHMAETAANYAVPLAKMAAEETGFGKWQDKIIKNLFASQKVYDYIKDMKTRGILHEDKVKKTVDIGVPVGVVAALIPSTNPTSTAIFKSLIAIKAGNGIVFSPHPSAKKCSKAAIDIVIKAAVEAGAPEGIIGCMENLTLEGTQALMKHKDTALILATGGEAMVRAAYRSGTPTISGGPGNGPAFIERSADIKKAVKRIVDSKTFDNGVICASEQSIVVEEYIQREVIAELKASGAYFLTPEESEALGRFLLKPNGAINVLSVGKTAAELGQLAGFHVPDGTTLLISPQKSVSRDNPYSREKLCPILAFYCEKDWVSACERCMSLLTNEGQGHTMVIHSSNEEVIREFMLQKPVSRILVNTPAALGGIGATVNIAPSLTLGCGAIGGGSTSDNVSPLNLINIRKAAYGVAELDELKPDHLRELQSVELSQPDDKFCSTDTGFAPALANAAGDTRFVTPAASGDTRFTAVSAPVEQKNTGSLGEQDTRFQAAASDQPAVQKDEQIARLLKEVMAQLTAS